MFPFDHDPTALRALLTADFEAICSTFKKSPQIEQCVALLRDTTRSILRDLLSRWNAENSIMHLPPEILALCFSFLPFRDRITASHVSQAWRDVTLHYPAVWSQIDIEGQFWDPTNLLSMALENGGACPVDLKAIMQVRSTWEHNGLHGPTLPPMFERHMHRMRSIDWFIDTDTSTDGPFPLLEYFKSDTLCLSEKALTGPLGRLRTLDVDFKCLPSTLAVPLTSVTHFVGEVPWAGHYPGGQLVPRLFRLFPNLQSLTLTGLIDSSMQILPQDAPPASLVHLTLSTARNVSLGTLVEHFLTWDRPQLKDVELSFLKDPNHLKTNEPSARCVPSFFAGAVEMSVKRSADGEHINLAGKTADGGSRTLVFQNALYKTDTLAHAIWRSIADSCDVLRSVALRVGILDRLLELARAGPFSAVETVVVQLEQVRGGPPYSLPLRNLLRRLPARFPALISFALEVDSDTASGAPSAEDARALLHHLAQHGVPDLPVLRILGFSREIVSTLDPQAVAQLPMRVEFDLAPV